MNNKELKEKLEKEWCLLAEDKKAYYRPFLCRGDPLKAKIALAGINPASSFTPDRISQEDYINLFPDYQKYMGKYMELRGNKESETRKGINKLILSLESAIKKTLGISNGKDLILETDVITYPTGDTVQLKDLPDEIKRHGQKIFFDVFQNIQPRLLILHGKDALEWFLDSRGPEKKFEIEYKEIIKPQSLKIRNSVKDLEKLCRPLFTVHFVRGNNCDAFFCRHLRFHNMYKKELENFQKALGNYIITTNCLR
jgi:hypothetical protein